MAKVNMFIGTYTKRGSSEGIYAAVLDSDSGSLEVAGVTGGIVDPSFLAFDASHRVIYAVNEVDDFGPGGGAVSAFAVEGTDRLRPLSVHPSGGVGPCHIDVAPDCRAVVVANYRSGATAALPIGSDGDLAAPASVQQHTGSSVNPQRQSGPHAHSANVDPTGGFVLVPDLGVDRVIVYRLQSSTATLEPFATGTVAPGSGPRHLAFDPNRPVAYVINELSSTITSFHYRDGTLREIETISTLPDGFSGTSHCADIHVHRSGRFLYGSNRGHDSIVVVALEDDGDSVRMQAIAHTATGGRTPRNFALAPANDLLLAANQDSDDIFSFFIDPEKGTLSPTGHSVAIPTPVCIRFVS